MLRSEDNVILKNWAFCNTDKTLRGTSSSPNYSYTMLLSSHFFTCENLSLEFRKICPVRCACNDDPPLTATLCSHPSVHPSDRPPVLSFIHSCTALFVYFRFFMCVHSIYAITLFPYLVYEKRKTDKRHIIGHT